MGAGFEIGRDGPGTVVVGVDDSEAASHALGWAVGTARRQGSELVLVTAVPLPGASIGFVPPPLDPPELSPERAAVLNEFLPGRWRYLTRNGEAEAELIAVAHELKADAIVVGRARHPSRHMLGSVASRLVRHADTPVVVVP
ncbi:MAG TPA: universal stress protein [Sporichthyaceae bacterium]|jgi:nucleotide-binding universal stress UspA family protein|nr:universal stress protein [Sporichthyaceae bacterium]